MKGKELKGKKVGSIKDGAKLGQVDDVLPDTEELRIAALHVKGQEEALVPFEKVASAGSDVITVPNSAAAQRPNAQDEAEHLASLGEVTKLKVIDEEGTFLGVVQSVEVDPQTGAILEMRTQKATAMGLGRESHTIAASERWAVQAAPRDRGCALCPLPAICGATSARPSASLIWHKAADKNLR